ncbi:MAG: glycoside hydrolase family 95 protein, partial [Verrucomicrobia bacterium]|nr:glycoside hydrolase family 95 protein [Verrucomicrobiota bacterium]
MTFKLGGVLLSGLVSVALRGGEVARPGELSPLALWYRSPATKWEEALPVGNGHLGGMVHGGVPAEHVQFNEHTVWTGRPHAYAHAGAGKFLPEIRRLLFEGRELELQSLRLRREAEGHEGQGRRAEATARQKEAQGLWQTARARQKAAEDLALKEFMSEPLRQKAYQPCGDLRIAFEGHDQPAGYRRWLELDRAVTGVEYQVGGATFRREVLASHPDRFLGVRLSADRPGRIDCTVRLDSAHPGARAGVEGATVILRGEVEPNGIRFEARAALTLEGGQVEAAGDGLRVTGADALVIRLVAATNFRSYRELSADPAQRCADLLQRSAGKSWEQLRQAHVADHQGLFRRVSLDLGSTPAAERPTDQRIREFAAGDDPQLATLTFQYGRYLLIASSRPGGQPANLQGIWNASLRPPWDSKYTCNINTQMNYWPAEVTALGECHEPLFAALA